MDPIMAEKAAARRRYRRLRHLHTLFRCLEAFALLFLFSWSSARLPSVAGRSLHLLGRLVAVLLGPRFIFLLGNAIVVVLFAMSGRHRHSSGGGGDIYDQFLACRGRETQSLPTPPPGAAAEEKEALARGAKAGRACRRTRSERMERRRRKPDLRRTKSEVSGEEEAAAAAVEEEDKECKEDAEEFRRTIEAFIEKQLTRIHRE